MHSVGRTRRIIGRLVVLYAVPSLIAGEPAVALSLNRQSALAVSEKAGAAVEGSAQLVDALAHELSPLFHEYYERAKITKTDRKLHIEYKTRQYYDQSTTRRQVKIPDFGGLICDIEIKPGEYSGKVKLPLQFNEHAFYSVLLMAPHSAGSDVHAYVKLEYAPDTVPDFLERFKESINKFDSLANIASGKGETAASNKVANSGPIAVPSNPPDGAVPGSSSTAVSSSTIPAQTKISSIGSAGLGASVASVVATSSVTDGQKAFLWKATKGSDEVYLLGTIHGAMAKFYPMPPQVDEAFDRSKHLMVEIAIDKVDGTKVGQLRDRLAVYTPPDHLSKHLTPETKKVFEDYLNWSGESWAMYEKFKPWYAAELAGQSKRWRADSFRASLGLDLYFLSRARETGKSISDLETIESQLRIDTDLSEAAQDMLLRVGIMGFKDLDAETNEYFVAWKAGDPERMYEVSTRHSRNHPELREYEKKLLDDRNVGMVAKIQQLMKVKPGPHFVAVGAAHLVGEMGLISLFKQEGFDVQQVAAQAPSAVADKSIKKQAFPEQFRIWLPSEAKRTVGADMTRYEAYEYLSGGGYVICIFTAESDPSAWSVPAPLLLDKLVSVFKPLPGSRKSLSLQGCPGREIECSGLALEELSKRASGEAVVTKNKAVMVKSVQSEVMEFIDFSQYQMQASKRLRRNWFPPRGREHLKPKVTFRYHNSGATSQVRLAKSSGDRVADMAALKAVQNASPLGPLPDGAPKEMICDYTFDWSAPQQAVLRSPVVMVAEQPAGFDEFSRSTSSEYSNIKGKIRAYLSGRRFYLVCAVGTNSFVASDNVKKFFDSLEFIR